MTIMVRSCARQNHFFHRVTCLCLLLGSPKIGTNCTSIMTARVYLNSQVSVSACHSNHGQSKTLQHLPLPKWQHKMMAAKIQHGVSRERILDNIRQSVNSTFNRQHLVDRQDLANLQRAYTLKNVLSWIGEWEGEMGHQSPVLYCKFLGEDAKGEHVLPSDNFSLVVQTLFHSEMLKKLAKNEVCCDSTHGTNGCDFPLTTIHVIDEFGEGVPTAWCISSHEDFSSMIVFFSEIKKCRTVRSAFFNEWYGQPVLQHLGSCEGG